MFAEISYNTEKEKVAVPVVRCVYYNSIGRNFSK